MTIGDKYISGGLPLLRAGLSTVILISIAIEHPKIWFSDSYNMEDEFEKMSDTPKENHPMYQDGIFTYSEFSFTVRLEAEILTIRWDEISLIRAYKIDQLAYDCIVIEIHLREMFFTINDETAGHMKFMDTASENLPGFKEDWFFVVAFPAFETNLTTIYKKQAVHDEDTTDYKNS